MESDHLKVFAEIVNSGCNMTTAAKKLFMSKSALDKLINKYEFEYNISLFNRSKGALTGLTPIGRTIYQYAKQVNGIFEELVEEISKAEGTKSEFLKIGIPVLSLKSLPKDFFLNFQNLHPNIRLDIIEGNSEELLGLVDEGELDIALVLDTKFTPNDAYESQLVSTNPLVAIFDKNHPLAARDKVSIKDLADYSISLLNEKYEINSIINNNFKSEGLSPNISLISSSWEMLASSTLHGTRITFLPYTYYKKLDQSLYAYSELDPSVALNLCVTKLKDHTSNFLKNSIYKQLCDVTMWTKKEG